MDLSHQAIEAKEQGIKEILKLLQTPDDLARLHELRTDYHNKLRASKQGVSSVVQTQVEATRQGVSLLEKAHRSVLKLRSSLDQITACVTACVSAAGQPCSMHVLWLLTPPHVLVDER